MYVKAEGKGKAMDTEMESLFARNKAKHVLALTMMELPERIIKTFKSLLNTAL